MKFHLMSDKERMEVKFWITILFALEVLIRESPAVSLDMKKQAIDAIEAFLKELDNKE